MWQKPLPRKCWCIKNGTILLEQINYHGVKLDELVCFLN